MSDLSALVLFTLFVLAMLGLDLGILQRRADSTSLRAAGLWMAFWVASAAAVNVGLLLWRGPQPALEFLTSYLLEGSLSFDNAFVFAAIFSGASVPAAYQHKVLFWGAAGALVMRGVFIFAGVELVTHYHFVLYIFAAILIVAGVRLFWEKRPTFDPERSRMLRLARKYLPITERYEGAALWVRRNGRGMATPLLMVLLLVEMADLVFAMDSVPAVFGVTRDPLVLYTSNILAVMGLRAMYILLTGAMAGLRYLRAGLSVILIFVGTKMLLEPFVRLPTLLTLATLCTILLAVIFGSLVAKRRERRVRG